MLICGLAAPWRRGDARALFVHSDITVFLKTAVVKLLAGQRGHAPRADQDENAFFIKGLCASH
jgi:hypothetical protein